MKTKKLIYSIAITAIVFAFASCSKSSTSSSSSSTGTDAQTQADDQNFYTNEADYATNDANTALNNLGGSYNQRPAGIQSPTGLTFPWLCDVDSTTIQIDTTGNNTHTITINYNGSNCGTYNHKRTGSIVVSFSPGFKWGTANASITINFNLKVVRTTDSKTINITGTRVITNVTGGLLKNLPALDSVAYTIADNTTITFDNGTQRSWQTSLRRTFTYNTTNGVVVTLIGSLNGTNRFGQSFSAVISEPLVVTECSLLRYVSGQITYTGALGGTGTATFGLDSTGNPTTGCVIGSLYYQFVWTGPNGGSYKSPYISY